MIYVDLGLFDARYLLMYRESNWSIVMQKCFILFNILATSQVN